MTTPKVYLDDPNIGQEEIEAVKRVMMRGDISTKGPEIEQFEKMISQYLGGGVECIAVNSGTSALFVSLLACGIGPGDEVIVPATTSAATANAVVMTGATPVFADVDPDTWCIDPLKTRNAITERTKAIMPVHLYGNPCDMLQIKTIANLYNLHIIEDACEALGAYYDGKPCGSIGDMGCFSFNRNKIVTTGGGGMVVTKDKEKAARIRKYVNQGKYGQECFSIAGNNLRMTNQAAALGIEQLKKSSHFQSVKKGIHLSYAFNKNIGKYTQNVNLEKEPFTSSTCWFTAIKLLNHNVTEISLKLLDKGIPTRSIFEPLPNTIPFIQYWQKSEAPELWPNAFKLWESGLCLPSSTLNDMEAIEYVAETLTEVLNES